MHQTKQQQRSAIRPIAISGHRTAVSLEDAFWDALKEIAIAKGTTRPRLASKIDSQRSRWKNLSSAIRLFVLAHYRSGEQTNSNGSRPTQVIKRSTMIAGRHTSLSLDEAFWSALKEIAASKQTTIGELIAQIDKGRQFGNLSSAIRVFVLAYYQGSRSAARSVDDGREHAQHGRRGL